ncbi:hypothetical protein QYM36_000746 [Artemia franciscana]|uniref:Helicase ATP-binding domain-containing protein n=1 Tax=Artemia franciscana TaxID=6661 RepID=A0AA88IE10_ARTSF|nr:hypothetical protein QYM36_000746 [Artemia franciscana]
MAPKARTTAWKENRVFFLTPQVMMNDLTSRACPAELIKCLVIDEAHKATGNHAYCQVKISDLALSATPGTDFPTLEAVLGNLRIGHIEVRTETSQDILPYIHGRSVDKIVVKLGKEVEEVKRRFIKV